MKLTRRELAGIVASVPAVAGSAALGSAELERSAVEDLQKNIAEIRKFKLPVETEPAFAFRAQ